jgi:hypothetical protein
MNSARFQYLLTGLPYGIELQCRTGSERTVEGQELLSLKNGHQLR